ncbi:sigma-70 family RNA polymerase sigma factor [Thioclava nitratireducens]|uniref:sigma-70 family RNA polymerase sigma factor n=1 Tax=Thioclava nitratireducens TaxID=1915078 RepID=UPI00247FFF51|nr:sigma-70 family RNA polymerase sigma factor [Thioclava nitratireducens]WGT49631.1 sigma-70 family RNA polymerase sigma factor [Thioclava nitratireducens]
MSKERDIIELIPALRSYAWALTKRREDVDDLVQETLVKAIDKVDSFQSGTNLRAWLMTIMRNTFLNNIAKSKRSTTGKKDCVSTTLSTPATQDWSVRGGELMRAVERLPRHYREVLIVVVMLGESYQDAANLFGIEMGTVKSRANRARAMVVEDLEARAPNDPLED